MKSFRIVLMNKSNTCFSLSFKMFHYFDWFRHVIEWSGLLSVNLLSHHIVLCSVKQCFSPSEKYIKMLQLAWNCQFTYNIIHAFDNLWGTNDIEICCLFKTGISMTKTYLMLFNFVFLLKDWQLRQLLVSPYVKKSYILTNRIIWYAGIHSLWMSTYCEIYFVVETGDILFCFVDYICA